MYTFLNTLHTKPKAFSAYTADALWTDPYRAQQMLSYHLNDEIEASSRNQQFIQRSCDWIIAHFNLDKQQHVADFGCGPGLYTSRLALSGAQVTGIDFSANSLAYAQQQARAAKQSIRYIEANYLHYQADQPVDLIIMIMCDFCALSPQQRQQLLANLWQALKPGGSLLLDVYSLRAFQQKSESSHIEHNQLFHFWSESDYYAIVNHFKYPEAQLSLDKYDIFPEQGQPFTVYNWLQYFSVTSLRQELSQAGFKLEQYYANVAGEPYAEHNTEFAVVARRPK